MSVVFNTVDGFTIHDFHGGWNDFGSNNIGHCSACCPRVLKVGKQGSLGFWRRYEFKSGFRDNAQRSFGADQKIFQRIAGDIFDTFSTCADFRPVSEYSREGHNVVAGHTIFQAAQSSSVFSNIAAQGGDFLGTGIRRIKQTLVDKRVKKVQSDDPSLGCGRQVLLVDFKNFIHSG